MGRDLFPTTRGEWIAERSSESHTGRLDVNNYLMEVYRRPLAIYCRSYLGISSQEALDVVAGFFASRLARSDYLEQWQANGMPLRKWLRCGLGYYIREQRKKQPRRWPNLHETQPDEVVDPGASSPLRRLVAEYDQAYVVSMVGLAMEVAAQRCALRGQETHWTIFVRHHVDQLPYAEAVAGLGITAVKGKEMARCGRSVFRQIVREQLIDEGIPPERVDQEIRSLLEGDR